MANGGPRRRRAAPEGESRGSRLWPPARSGAGRSRRLPAARDGHARYATQSAAGRPAAGRGRTSPLDGSSPATASHAGRTPSASAAASAASGLSSVQVRERAPGRPRALEGRKSNSSSAKATQRHRSPRGSGAAAAARLGLGPARISGAAARNGAESAARQRASRRASGPRPTSASRLGRLDRVGHGRGRAATVVAPARRTPAFVRSLDGQRPRSQPSGRMEGAAARAVPSSRRAGGRCRPDPIVCTASGALRSATTVRACALCSLSAAARRGRVCVESGSGQHSSA